MKKLTGCMAFVFALNCIGIPLSYGIIPTTDVAAIAQLVKQLEILTEQYKELKSQTAALTGKYKRGEIGWDDAINASSIVPGSWQEVVARQGRGEFGNKQNQYENMINTLPVDQFGDSDVQKGRRVTTYKMSTDAVRTALAGGDALYGEIQTHLNNLAKLGRQVDSTENIKDAADLQNRISIEAAMLQSAMAKVMVINMNLQTNLLNQQNQATAINQSFYEGKSKLHADF